jgi:L-ascorbate metabolism protein UlaG (beta-lactamase superfamily)
MTLNERSAVRAVQAIHPKVVIPIHLGIQPRAPFLRSNQSLEGFQRRLKNIHSSTEVKILSEGEQFIL